MHQTPILMKEQHLLSSMSNILSSGCESFSGIPDDLRMVLRVDPLGKDDVRRDGLFLFSKFWI